MRGAAGFRYHKTLSNVTSGDLGTQFLVVEVTNGGITDVLFYGNDFTEQGHPPGEGIPIVAGTTREIPLTIYNFKASGPVTVVAYAM